MSYLDKHIPREGKSPPEIRTVAVLQHTAFDQFHGLGHHIQVPPCCPALLQNARLWVPQFPGGRRSRGGKGCPLRHTRGLLLGTWAGCRDWDFPGVPSGRDVGPWVSYQNIFARRGGGPPLSDRGAGRSACVAFCVRDLHFPKLYWSCWGEVYAPYQGLSHEEAGSRQATG